MSQKLELLRAIVNDMVREASPGKRLEGEEAVQWAAAFAFSRVAVSGERIGIRRVGVAAANKLASVLAKTQPAYHRGANPRNLTQAILNASVEAFTDRVADSISTADILRIEKAVSEWFAENVKPRTYFVPCSIIPDLHGFSNAHPFIIGPVVFCHLSDFLKRKGIGNLKDNPIDEINYGQLVRAMAERSAKWVAEVEIDGCEEARASEMADLAVDVPLVGIQLVIPWSYSRNVARITGRTMPPWIGSVHTSGSRTISGIRWCDPGLGLSGGAFDEMMSKQTAILESVGRRVDAYVRGGVKLPNLEQAWCDAAYWFHEGLAEPLDTIAVAKLETAIEVFLIAESTKLSKKRLCQAIQAFYGRKETDPFATDASITVKQFVEGIVGARSRILHGTLSTLMENVDVRGSVEVLSFDLLRRSSLALDGFSALAAPDDTAKAFLDWIDEQRQAGAAG
jgi:hypothetical protein